MSNSPLNGVSCFKRMLVKVSQGLSSSDVRHLAFLWGVPEDKAGSALDVFSALIKEGEMSEDHYDILLTSLVDISRKDLLKVCQEMMAQKQDTSPQRGGKRKALSHRKRTKATCLQQRSLHDYYKDTNSKKCHCPSNIEAESRAYRLQLMRDEVFIKLLETISLTKGTQCAACVTEPSVPSVLSQGWDHAPGIEAATDAIFKLRTSGERNEYTLYSTFFPSFESLKLIARAGIKEVVYCEKDVPEDCTDVLEEYDIKCRKCPL